MDALPPPTSNRFAHLTPDDHSAPLWVVTLLCSIYAVLVLAVRLGYVKWRAYRLDDYVLTLAHLVGLAMWGLLFASVGNGLGKSFNVLDDAEISKVQKTFFASRIILYIALALSKCSILILVPAVFERNSKVSLLANGTMAFVAIWGLVGILSHSVGCSPERVIPKPGSSYCVNSTPWLIAVAAGDIISELVIILLALIAVCDTLTSVKRKFNVVLAFSTRIPNIAFTLMYLLAYSEFINDRRPAMHIVSTVAWQNVLLSYSLMSATIPLLKGFTIGFGTAGVSLGYSREGDTTDASGTQQIYELPPLPRSKPSPQNRSRCYHDDGASLASQDSQQIMIKQEWKVSSNK